MILSVSVSGMPIRHSACCSPGWPWDTGIDGFFEKRAPRRAGGRLAQDGVRLIVVEGESHDASVHLVPMVWASTRDSGLNENC